MNTRERHERLSRLYLHAASLGAADRDRFLETACPDDPGLRSELKSLLAHGPSSPAILATGGPLAAGLHPAAMPPFIGPYRTIRVLGEGGMGVVILAEQERPVRRQVALKLVKRGLETRSVLARFESERQALAVMQHPNVAVVFDAGVTSDGTPYFAMEYVNGEPITAYCDRHRLSIDARLELFRAVCAGVQHAHQHLLLHRDLKPANVLVTGPPDAAIPKVIDFGVAKALDPGEVVTTRTIAGELVGTPEYMSPEQCAADGTGVGTQSDVYSLGVVLYELLTGALPIDCGRAGRTSIDELRRMVREEDPPLPSARVRASGSDAAEVAEHRNTTPAALARALRGELDWIVARALAKEPERRYPSPAELSADLLRQKTNEPVVAGPPSRAYRVRKFARRNRTAVSAAALLAIAVLGFGAAMSAQARRIARERDRASQEAATAKEVSGFLARLFQDTNPWAGNPASATGLEILERGVARVETELAGQPAVQARLMLTLGELMYDIVGSEKGIPLLDQAVLGLERTLGAEHPETIDAKLRAAVKHNQYFMHERSTPLLVEVLAAKRRAAGIDDPATIRVQTELARSHVMAGRIEDAEALQEDAIDRLTRVKGAEDAQTLRALSALGNIRLSQERYDEGEVLMRQALDGLRRVSGESDKATLTLYFNLSWAAARRGDAEEAIEFLRRSLEGGFWYGTREEKGKDYSGRRGVLANSGFDSVRDHPRFQALFGDDGPFAHYELAIGFMTEGKPDAARRELERAVEAGFSNGETFRSNPVFAPLLGDPAYEAIVKRANEQGQRALARWPEAVSSRR